MRVSARLQDVAETLAARPDERLLEVGCGQGVVVGLVAAGLRTGHIIGLDRSAAMIEQATRRNAAAIADGRATLVHADLEAFGPATASRPDIAPGSTPLSASRTRRASSPPSPDADMTAVSGRIDTVFAARVAAFRTRSAAVLPVVGRLLAPGGGLVLFLDSPAPGATAALADETVEALARNGFTAEARETVRHIVLTARPG